MMMVNVCSTCNKIITYYYDTSAKNGDNKYLYSDWSVDCSNNIEYGYYTYDQIMPDEPHTFIAYMPSELM